MHPCPQNEKPRRRRGCEPGNTGQRRESGASIQWLEATASGLAECHSFSAASAVGIRTVARNPAFPRLGNPATVASPGGKITTARGRIQVFARESVAVARRKGGTRVTMIAVEWFGGSRAKGFMAHLLRWLTAVALLLAALPATAQEDDAVLLVAHPQ